MIRNFCKNILDKGGKLTPLIIPSIDSKGLGLMNPSILVEQDKILLNLRNINYTLYHSENQQLFNNRWGPLVYLNPENDPHLRTFNFLCELNPVDLTIIRHNLIDTSKLDKEPLWEFVGLEDIRLVRWEGKLYGCGVRRDTTTNGEGRMEMSELIEIINPNPGESPIKEISRVRIQTPKNKPSYCEKNWMPVLDMPYYFVKWTNPTELVKVNPITGSSETVFLSSTHIPNLPDFRGGSQILRYKDYRVCMIHEVDLFNNRLDQKDGKYRHRFIVWDLNWNIVKYSEAFSFMDGEIEFSCGMAFYQGDLLLTFGFQDNAAYTLRVPEKMIDEIFGLKEPDFKWGEIENNQWFKEVLTKEIFEENTYQKFFQVEEGDIVVDVGASIGPFTYSILKNKPSKVFCIEPDAKYFPTLLENTIGKNEIIPINSAIFNESGIIKHFNEIGFNGNIASTLNFMDFINDYGIEKIDFLKLDCEGAEYHILNTKNFDWVHKNVKKIAGEFHLFTNEQKENFKIFRDTYLNKFESYVYSMDGIDIKWDLWSDHFIEYYSCIMVYINLSNPSIIKDLSKKWKSVKWPTIEITTNIPKGGCPIMCDFCPQNVILTNYKGNKELSLENFKHIIETIPRDISIIFSGFSEPFLNKSCADMILYAHEKGHNIAIFTTGIGMTIEDFEKIKNIPFTNGPNDSLRALSTGLPINNGGFTLHLPDKDLHAKHPITQKYLKLLEHIKENQNSIRNFRLATMGEIHDKVKTIFPNAPIIDIWARANNLKKEMELRPEIISKIEGKYKSAYRGKEPTTCMCDEGVFHNVVLPNGEVVLCCMDYSMEHILGNLLNKSYEEIIPNPLQKFNLCRFCENGKQYQ